MLKSQGPNFNIGPIPESTSQESSSQGQSREIDQDADMWVSFLMQHQKFFFSVVPGWSDNWN